MSHHSVDYASLIHEKGYRLTWQREVVLDAVCAAGDHVGVEDICARVQISSPEIDRSTIYRSLDFLSEMRLINASVIDGERMYEIAIGQPHHHHLTCHSCGAELEIPEKHFSALFNEIEAAYGFKPDASHLILTGICAACRHKSVSEE